MTHVPRRWGLLLIAAFAATACTAQQQLPDRSAAVVTQSVQRENLRQGSRSWRITRPAGGSLAAFASRSSVAPGETVDLAVSARTADTRVTIEVFRLGWYSGLGGRSMLTAGPIPAPALGTWTPANGAAGLAGPTESGYLSLGWPPIYTLAVRADWTSGYYIFKITDAAGLETYAPFIVRDDVTPHDLLVQASVTTWQAYNGWGGYSLYGRYDASGKFLSGAPNGRIVSFDRPYENDDGAGFMLSQELALVSWIEEQGYDAAYATDLDTDAGRPSWLPKIFISLGHDEYWSEAMRLNASDLRAQGTHLAFFGGNNVYWQTRLGARRNGEAREEARVALWRAAGGADSALTGQTAAGVVTGGYADLVITNADHWIFAGTALRNGDHVSKVIGYEADRVNPAAAPPGIEILATSPFTSTDPAVGATFGSVSIYRAPSGSWVFDAGTINWPASVRSDGRVAAITINVLARMLKDAAPAARVRGPVPTPSPVPVPTPANPNLFKNGQPLAGSDQLSNVTSGMRVAIVDDAGSLTGHAYRLDLASAISLARAVPIAVDAKGTYCVAAQIRTDGALQVRMRVLWIKDDGQSAGPDGVAPLVASATYVESVLTALKPPAGAASAIIAVAGTAAGTAYLAGIRVQPQSGCDAWRPQLQYQ